MSAIQQILAALQAASSGGAAVTWNPSDKGGNITLSSGNLTATKVTADGYQSVRATAGRDATHAGGYYFEVQLSSAGGTAPYATIGIGTSASPNVASEYVGQTATSYSYYQETGTKITNATGTAYGASYTTGDVIGVLVKNGKVYFRKNGTWQNSGDPTAETGFAFSGLTGTVYPVFSPYRASGGVPHVGVGRFKATDISGSLPSGVAAWE
ncbi:SPRY domain-containing protein [Lysobacter olei]